MISNTTGSVGNMNEPVIKTKNRKHIVIDVDGDTYRKFLNGNKRYSRWNSLINQEDENHLKIKTAIHKGNLVLLRNLDNESLCTVRRYKHG